MPEHAEIAQLVEHATENRGVASSILALGISRPDGRGGLSAAPFRFPGAGVDPPDLLAKLVERAQLPA